MISLATNYWPWIRLAERDALRARAEFRKREGRYPGCCHLGEWFEPWAKFERANPVAAGPLEVYEAWLKAFYQPKPPTDWERRGSAKHRVRTKKRAVA